MDRRPSGLSSRVDVQMTPMIDVVFQLLTFFLMTFRIAVPEGDFHLRLPADLGHRGLTDFTKEVVSVRLSARADGDLAEVQFDRRVLRGPDVMHALQIETRRRIEAARAAGQDAPEFHLSPADSLHYDYVVQALSALSARIDADTGDVVPLARQVKLTAGD